MAITRTFKDAIPKTENRHYQQINNADGTVSLVDVTEYEQEGTVLNADTLNAFVGELNEYQTILEEEITEAVGDLTNKADKSTMAEATLLASGWSGNTYTLTVSGVTATSTQEILPSVATTVEQLEALQGANIQDGGQSANTIILKAFGEVPTIDIPIRIILRGDM